MHTPDIFCVRDVSVFLFFETIFFRESEFLSLSAEGKRESVIMEVKSASASSDSSIRQPGEVKSFFKRIRSKKGNQVGFYSIRFSLRRRRRHFSYKTVMLRLR